MQGQSPATYIDVFQGHEVEGKPVALPDDGGPQLSTDSAGQHCTQSHSHCGHADPLLGCEAELNHLCRGKGENLQVHTSIGSPYSQANNYGGSRQGRRPRALRLSTNYYGMRSKCIDGHSLLEDRPQLTGNVQRSL